MVKRQWNRRSGGDLTGKLNKPTKEMKGGIKRNIKVETAAIEKHSRVTVEREMVGN